MDDELFDLKVAAAVKRGMNEYFNEFGVTPDHWAWLRRQKVKSDNDGGLVRRVAITVVLTAAFVFGVNAVTDYAAKKTMERYYNGRMDVDPRKGGDGRSER